jgi:hypothetical protein
MADKIFADGISVKEGSEKTPWIKARFGINKKFIEFYEKHKDERGWLNIDLCESKDKTKMYVELNTWKPNGQNQVKEEVHDMHQTGEDDIAF